MTVDLAKALTREEVLPLDGGLATTLEDAGHDTSGPLWSARLLHEDPAAVRAAHQAFAAAGARVVTTATYQLSVRGLRDAGQDPALLPELVRRAVALAREVEGVLVAGSVGPYGATLPDGGEYRGRYDVTAADLKAFHEPRLAALLDAGVDLLACETIPSGSEVAVLADMLRGIGTPAWVSLTLGGDGRHTVEGEPLVDALAAAAEIPGVVAVGVNCGPGGLVPVALDTLATLGRPLVAYPNAGARWDPRAKAWRAETVPDASRWVTAGARLVGGCCGTTPRRLERLLATLGR